MLSSKAVHRVARWARFPCLALLVIVAAYAIVATGLANQPVLQMSLDVLSASVVPERALVSGWVEFSSAWAEDPDIAPLNLDPGISAPVVSSEVLPSRVYVLANGEIVDELPQDGLEAAQGDSGQPDSNRTTVAVTATVLPSRLIVVDELDNIAEVWSNTDGLEHDFYCLRVTEDDIRGPEHALTTDILTQYNDLLAELDWALKGQVYGPSDY